MIEVASEHPPGLVGIISGSQPRFYEFFDSLDRTVVPVGTHNYRAFSCNPVNNCNSLMRNMPPDAEWLWLLGDDHDWDPNLLIQLLDHKVDLVVPIVARRVAPWAPVVFNAYRPAPDGVPHTDTRGYSWQALSDAAQYDNGLLTIAAAGSAGLLIRRHVWETIQEVHGDPIWRIGTTGPDSMAEDLDFTWKAHKLGFGCYVDTKAYMGHLVPISLMPRRTPDGLLELSVQFYENQSRSLIRASAYREEELIVRPRPHLTVVE